LSDLKVSHSQLQVWSSCEQKWWYSYALGLQPKVKAHYFSTGDFTHKGLEVVYNARKSGFSWDETIQKLIANWREQAPEMMRENLDSFKKATRVIKRYVTSFAPKADAGIRILGVEVHFEVELPTPKGNAVVVEGYIDLIVEINGVLFAWDHKTIGSSSFWTQEEAMLDPQFGIYTLALRMQGYPVKGFIINQLNVYDYAKFDEQPNEKLFKRLETYRTDEHLRGIANNITTMADELIAKREGHAPIVRHLSKTTCKGCIFRQPCLYELKGIDVTNLLAQDYVKRTGREDEIPDEKIEDLTAYALKL
jgi:ATP-dependent helicase/DNAse subunit B